MSHFLFDIDDLVIMAIGEMVFLFFGDRAIGGETQEGSVFALNIYTCVDNPFQFSY